MNHSRYLNLFAIFATSIVISACSIVPRVDTGGYANQQADREDKQVRRASFPRCPIDLIYGETDSKPACDSNLFLGIAVSGGGSRAANFGLGVLWELQQLGILDHATALSSVSGGSLAATYLALHGLNSPLKFDDAAKAMRQDFLDSWELRSLDPLRILRVNTTHQTATDTLADTFDSLLFHGATFSDLGTFRPGRPYLYINASLQNPVTTREHITTRGANASSGSLQGFTFTQAAFSGIDSDLSKYRLADAVAASGAFPAVFEAMTLRNYSKVSLPGDPPNKYLHLLDGGLADNLGVDALVRALEESRDSVLNPLRKPQACLLILVDAAVHAPMQDAGAREDLRATPLDSIVNVSSLERGFDILLDRRREDQLYYLGINVSSDSPMRFNPSVPIPFGNYSYIDGGTYKEVIRGPGFRLANQSKAVFGTTCAIWHISFDHLLEIAGLHNRFLRENYGSWTYLPNPMKDNIEGSIRKMDYFINSIKTDYKLTLERGNGCSAKNIQHAIFDAAKMLVRSDHTTLKELSNWFRKINEPALAFSIERAAKPLHRASSMQRVSVNQGGRRGMGGDVFCHGKRDDRISPQIDH